MRAAHACESPRPAEERTTVKLREIYETAVRMGIEADPRGRAGVDEFLARTKKRYDALPDYLKALADPEELTNPFNDTRIYVGDSDSEVKTLIGGIDMNTDQAIDATRLLEIPFFSAHTPTDNLVVDYLNKHFAKRKPTLIEDVHKALLEIPEYRIAAQKGAGPYIGKSSPGARAGKILIDMTGGTEGPKTVSYTHL